MRTTVAALAALILFSGALKRAATPITTIILVRHAEKAGASGDVPLSELGLARVKELNRVLVDVKLAAVYTTPYLRTEQTAGAVAVPRGLEPVVVEAGKTYAHDVVAKILHDHTGDTVLIVGHSNTTVDVLKELGVVNPPAIADSEYDNLFIVTIAKGSAPKMLKLHFGS